MAEALAVLTLIGLGVYFLFFHVSSEMKELKERMDRWTEENPECFKAIKECHGCMRIGRGGMYRFWEGKRNGMCPPCQKRRDENFRPIAERIKKLKEQTK